MPSNQTPNYALNQWSRDDRVLMDDFNADNETIDKVVKAVDRRVDALAASKADASALTAVAQTAAAEHIHIGSIQGDGVDGRTIQLPWAPKFGIVMGRSESNSMMTFLLPGYWGYIHEKVSLLKDDSDLPKLDGDKLIFQVAYWLNAKNQTTLYVMFR